MAMKKLLLVALAVLLIGVGIGFFIGKKVYNKPFESKVERDTVTMWDTIPHWYPIPVTTKPLKPQYKWLTKVEYSTDTFTLHDSVLVEVPIVSKHYHGDEYDAYVSGFNPNLDSIFVRQRIDYITERVVVSKPPNKLEFDVVGGLEYGITSKEFQPFAGGELILNNHKRLKLGIGAGVKKNEFTKDFDPYAEVKAKFRVF